MLCRVESGRSGAVIYLQSCAHNLEFWGVGVELPLTAQLERQLQKETHRDPLMTKIWGEKELWFQARGDDSMRKAMLFFVISPGLS